MLLKIKPEIIILLTVHWTTFNQYLEIDYMYRKICIPSTYQKLVWRDGRVVECDCLENSCPFTGTVGSNPSLSAIYKS